MNFKLLNRIVIGLLITGGILVLFGLISIWLIAGGILGYLVFLLIVSTNVQFNFFVNAFNRNPEVSGKKVAITFDDGPVENTLKILEILDKYNVKASFFCIGKNIEENPEMSFYYTTANPKLRISWNSCCYSCKPTNIQP